MSAGTGTVPVSRPGLLLGLGLGFSTATQFRGPGGIGPAEALLGSWCVLAVIALARGRRFRMTAPAMTFAVFWAISLAAIAAGWLVGMATDVSANDSVRDFLAFLLSATVFGLLLTREDAGEEALRAAYVYSLVTVLGLGTLLLASFLNGGKLGPFDVWYFGLRFQGWATNPNQIALAVLPIPYLAFYLAGGRTRPGRMFLGLIAAGAVALGIITQSDALTVAWILSLVAVLPIGWIWRVARPIHGFWSNVSLKVLVPVMTLLLIVVTVPMFAHKVAAKTAERFNAAGQSEGRLERWRNGMISATSSPVIGLGPGPFSGPRSSFGHEEAHNTIVDWTASTGMVGFAGLLLLLATAVIATIRRRSATLLGMFLALLFFMAFHYVMRQPAFWFVLLLPQLLPRDRPRAA
jgi:O-antigen ligase